MGFLDNSSITVDAILTKRGRQILSQGGNFQITKFIWALVIRFQPDESRPEKVQAESPPWTRPSSDGWFAKPSSREHSFITKSDILAVFWQFSALKSGF